MAHEYAMLHMSNPQYKDVDDLEMVQWAFDYADAMQAEAGKRITEVRIDGVSEEHADALRKACGDEWQPDWSVAPDNAMYWAMDGCGQCNWYAREPEVCDNQWDFGRVIEQAHTGYDYNGNWQNSLRKRPK